LSDDELDANGTPGEAAPSRPRQPLWERLRVHGDADARAELIEAYRPFARKLAAVYYGRRIDDEIAFDDYHHWALVAMIEALDRFDDGLGVKFETFASRRMGGAILDGIESATEKQRQISMRRRLRASRVEDVKALAADRARTPRRPAPVDDSALLGYLAEVGVGLALSLMLEGTGLVETSAPTGAAAAELGYARIQMRQMREALHASIEQLSGQERSVIRSHYLHDHSFETICDRMQLSKGRVSQLHRQALGKLRGILGEHRRRDLLL